MRLRILLGGIGLTLGLALYAGLVMALAARLPENAVLAFGFYAIAGVVWIAPASLVTRWMLRAAPYRPPPAA
jgi:hypothetical protein